MSQSYLASSALASRIVDAEAVILSHTTHRCYALNGSGTEVWQALSRPSGASLDQLCSLWPGADCRADVEALLSELLHEGLIEPGPADPAPLGPSSQGYARPFLESYEKLEQLILSGE